MYNTGLWITTCTAVPLILERSVATYRKEKYEKSSVCFGISLSILQCLIAAVPLSFAYSNTAFDGVFMPYCSVYKPGFPDVAQANAFASIGAQATARLLFGYLFRVNKELRQSMLESSLSTRFQLEENKNSMQCLKIYANLSTGFLFFQTFSFIWLLRESKYLRHEHYLALMEFNCAFPLYGIISVVLVTQRMQKLRNQISSSLTSHVQLESKLYHEHFQKQMDEPKSKTTRF
ncbi:unnamed protein product [Caenorhabditis sp. 36 PRJEB53466]|nr:unnamed protein product [Caenorhabditis sp. 36 PRJEB53466]